MTVLQNLPSSIIPVLFDTMNEGVWIGDDDEKTLYVNQRYLELSGYSAEEVLGKSGYTFWDDTTNTKIREKNRSERKKGISSQYEGKLRRKDGKLIPLNIQGSPLPDGGTIGIITDMSAYVEKRGSERLLLSAIRHSLQGIIMLKKGKIITWNRGAKYILGHKESEIIGNSLTGIFMKEDIKKLFDIHDEDIEIEVLGKRKDGERVSLILTVVNSKDDPDISILLLRNITHIRKSEEILAQKHDYLMQTVREYGVIKRKMEYFQELERLFYRTETDLQKTYDFFVHSLAHIASVSGCGLRILDHEKNELHLVADYGLGTLKNGENILPYAGSITEESYIKMKPVRILDLMNNPRLRTLTMAQTQRFQSGTMYAFCYDGKCLGSVMLFMEDSTDPFDDEFLMHYIELFGLLLGGKMMR